MSRPPSKQVWVVVALSALCLLLFAQTRRDAAALRTLSVREDATRGEYEQAIGDITAIEDSLNAISERGAGLRSSALATERRLSPSRGEEALAKVGELRAGVDRAREQIDELESRLHGHGAHPGALDRLVDRLKIGVEARQTMLTQLGARVDSLRRHVTGLTAQVAAQQAELGTVRYRIGSRRELLKDGVVVARGGVLGVGRTLDASVQMDETTFDVLDTNRQSVLPLRAERARVITPQPADSYRLERVDGLLELRILDARAFRKVRTLVIVTA